MINWNARFIIIVLAALTCVLTACDNGVGVDPNDGDTPSDAEFTNLLTNQINEVILPTMNTYQSALGDLVVAVEGFAASMNEANLATLRSAYADAYVAYQAAAVHDYYATANQALVATTNLFPVDTVLLANLIANESYSFSTSAQERANGFPALDYLLYGPRDVVGYFSAEEKRIAFLEALVDDMKARADRIVDTWNGSLKTNFVGNGGTQLGSSVSVQLNETLVYYEDHIRENKVGIPVGLLGPNDSPIPADPTKIEAYYQSLADGDEAFSLALLRASMEEMEDFYLGQTSTETDGAGYDDLLVSLDQASVDTDIKSQFATIYAQLDSRTSISGDASLYNDVQGLVTLFKSDLFPVLNVQDADGANDGD